MPDGLNQKLYFMTINYQKFIDQNPLQYLSMINSKGQVIYCYEHQMGYTYPIVVVCHDIKIAFITEFYELDDMISHYDKHEPSFIDGKLLWKLW